MAKLQRKHHTIEIFLDEDGYTAYYKEFPNISAGGDTEEEALRELAIAFELAQECQKKAGKPNIFSLSPIVAHGI